MKKALDSVTVEDLYRNKTKPSLNRKVWYLDEKNLRPRKQFRWTVKERALLYDLRVVKEWSIPNIQSFFRKKNGIPLSLGIDDKNDKFSRTRIHNQIRMVRGSFKGLCYKCRSPLTKKDLKRINRKEKEDPSLGLCLTCVKETSEYKKEKRERELEKGICPVCVKRKLAKGHTTCRKCLSASHRYRYLLGLCGRCGEKPLAKNSVAFCSECLEENKLASRASRATANKKGIK